MIYQAAAASDVPNVDLLTFLFDSQERSVQDDTILHTEASDPSIFYRKSQTVALTKRIAFGLRKKFCIGSSGPGKDVVSVIVSGQTMSPMLFYGIIAAGGVYSPSNLSSTAVDLARQIRQGDSRLIICSHDTKGVALEAARICGLPISRILMLQSKPVPRLVTLEDGADVISDQELDWEKITGQEELESTMVCLLYSSGTSGLPKAVCTSHYNMVAQIVLYGERVREYLQASEARGQKIEYKTLAGLPTAHIAGLVSFFCYSAFIGGHVYWMPRFSFPEFLKYYRQYRLTWLFSVPPIYLLIAKSSLVTDHFDSVEVAVSAAAPLGRDVQYLASSKLGKGKILISQVWGLSETTGAITALPWHERDDTGSVSRLLPGMSLRIIDEKLREVPPGSPGELLCKGPVVTRGYHKNPQATRDAFLDGWFRTGDIGEFRDGKVYIVDRKKDLIKYKALQVAPAELETVLLSHPLIADAAVIGVQGNDTELPRAYVVADQTKIDEAQIKAFVKERVADYKQLRGGVVFVDSIPKNTSGKILKKDLRALAQKEAQKEGRAKL